MEQKKTSYGALAGSAIAGAVLTAIVGFTYGGWTTEKNAAAMSNVKARIAVEEAMVPFCLAKAKQDPEYESKRALIDAASSWQRDDVLIDTGWATLPGYEKPDQGIADACAKAVLAA